MFGPIGSRGGRPARLARQLKFPALASLSGDATTLDDYRELPWTPDLQFSSAKVGITYGATTGGRITKIGRKVFFDGVLTLTSKGSSTGAVTINGLLFTAANDVISSSVYFGYAAGLSSITGSIIGLVQPNTSRIVLYHSNNGSASALSNTNFGNTTTLYFSGFYDV